MWNSENVKTNRGFTLIEVIIAMLIIVVGLLGVFSATQQIVSYITFSNSKFTASYLAQEGLELVRNKRDNNWLNNDAWDTGLTNCSSTSTGCEIDYDDTDLVAYGAGSFLNIESASGFYGYDAGNQTKFKRKITIDNSIIDILKITVFVEWSGRGESHSITVKGNLHNWLNN